MKSGLTGQCPTEPDNVRLGLSILVNVWFNSFHFENFIVYLSILATSCKCVPREMLAGLPLKSRSPPLIVQVEDKISLLFCLIPKGR
jgi:hypothetical protein